MKQETFKKLVTLSAVGMTAYTVHCLLQLIPAVRELTNRFLPSSKPRIKSSVFSIHDNLPDVFSAKYC